MKLSLAVIGGGPAGLIAAGKAASLGTRVTLLEKNPRLGAKLLLTGGGRCNFTNTAIDPRRITEQYGRNGRFFTSALTRFGIAETMAFFSGRGVTTKVEAGRVFPASDRARDILDALSGFAKENRVEVRLGAEVREIVGRADRIEKLILTNGSEVEADNYLLATGGKSFPETGSTGDAYAWLEALGHTVVPPKPSLCAIVTRGPTAGELQGLSLRDIDVAVLKNGKKVAREHGDVLFTGNGLSGPAILNVSKAAGKALPGPVRVQLDLFADKDGQEVDAMLVALFAQNGRRSVKNTLAGLLPERLAPIIMRESGVSDEATGSTVTREERRRMVGLLKGFGLDMQGTAGIDTATVTAGGVDLREVDSKTMRSKIVENLFFAGEVLDLDGPTGGYNLQICWSTGMAAAAMGGFLE